jgi:predicted Zn-dependent protease
MSDFFKTLQKENNESGALEFLRTHPLTKNRIIETENLASNIKEILQMIVLPISLSQQEFL